ncbi:putative twitching motility protein PilU, partial [Vibrio parahaemolyticus V-223/04]
RSFAKAANQTLLSSEIVAASVLVLFFSENCRVQLFAVSKPSFLLLSS